MGEDGEICDGEESVGLLISVAIFLEDYHAFLFAPLQAHLLRNLQLPLISPWSSEFSDPDRLEGRKDDWLGEVEARLTFDPLCESQHHIDYRYVVVDVEQDVQLGLDILNNAFEEGF